MQANSLAIEDDQLSTALEAVWSTTHRPRRRTPADLHYNPWRQIEPCMAYMRSVDYPMDEYATLIHQAYATMR